MDILPQLMHLDTQLTLWFNGSDSSYLDSLIMLITSTWVWLPLGFVLLYRLFRHTTRIHFALLVLMLGLCILFSDQMASGICKPYFQRFRPSQDPALIGLVDLVDGYKGGLYGFFSSHAANTFSLFTFFALVFRKRILTYLLLSWTLLNVYSRLYLGVHYVGDVLTGIIWGAFVGYMLYRLYHWLVYRYLYPDTQTAQKAEEAIQAQAPKVSITVVCTYIALLLLALFR